MAERYPTDNDSDEDVEMLLASNSSGSCNQEEMASWRCPPEIPETGGYFHSRTSSAPGRVSSGTVQSYN